MLHNDLKVSHRDIKPDNILYIKDKYKLCDLGKKFILIS